MFATLNFLRDGELEVSMKMEEKIKEIRKKHDELERLLQDGQIMADPQKIKSLSREYNELGQALAAYEKLSGVRKAKMPMPTSSLA
jgi:protein subunit release factor A